VAEPKREEEKIFSYDTGEPLPSEPSFLGEDSAPGGSAPGEESAPAVEVAKLRAEKEDLLQTLVRRQADFENYRKRVERDRHDEARRGVERLIADVIPVLDGFDRALQAHDDPAYEEYRKGMMLIRKQLWDALARHGVERMDAAGKIFDPHVHQAIERAESKDHPDGLILQVFQDGYLFHGRVVRPAIVRVVVHTNEDTNSGKFEN
jgi:molecular chaperone GrpE